METVLSILKKTEAFLEKKGIEKPRLDAERMLANILGCKRLELYLNFERLLGADILDQLRPWVLRRASREPLQYILGEVCFGDIVLKVSPAVLIPRPETEYICERIVEWARLQDRPLRILDLGTGSGAVALYMAKALPLADICGVDKSEEALEMAKKNACLNGLGSRVVWLNSDWLEAVEGVWDIIISNPPYLTEEEWVSAQDEVRVYEPKSALVSPDEGLKDLQSIIINAKQYLHEEGLLVLEMGIDQATTLERLAKECGYTRVDILQDLTKRDRFMWIQR